MQDASIAGAAQARDREVRHRAYRESGWWLGERLQDRYVRLAGPRLDALAVTDSRGRRLTHRQLIALSQEYAEALSHAGVGRGDVALLQLPNWVEWQALFLAALRMGSIPATIPLRTDAASLLHVVQTTAARAVLVPSGPMGNEARDAAAGVAAQCANPVTVLEVGSDSALRETGKGRGSAAPGQKPAALDHLMFTSSTTGRPKSVVHTMDTLAALNITFSERFSLGADSPIFMPSPLGHSVGGIHGARLALFNASALVLQERWDPEQAIAMVDEYRCAFTAAATPFLHDLVAAARPRARAKLEPLRWFLCGGAPVPPSLMDRTREEFPKTRVSVLWGMTEGGLTTCTAESPWEKYQTTCGIGLPGLEIRILDGQGDALPPGTEGELAIRGPGVFVGYLGQEDLYRSCLTPEEFFRTGDLATLDADGYMRVTGRLKELIIRGGVNISPVPIEDAIAAHPGVGAVAVVGYPDPRLGERICAVIEAKDARPELTELAEFVRASGLPKYHCPEILHFVDSMPRTPAGKIRKVELRAMLAASART